MNTAEVTKAAPRPMVSTIAVVLGLVVLAWSTYGDTWYAYRSGVDGAGDYYSDIRTHGPEDLMAELPGKGRLGEFVVAMRVGVSGLAGIILLLLFHTGVSAHRRRHVLLAAALLAGALMIIGFGVARLIDSHFGFNNDYRMASGFPAYLTGLALVLIGCSGFWAHRAAEASASS